MGERERKEEGRGEERRKRERRNREVHEESKEEGENKRKSLLTMSFGAWDTFTDLTNPHGGNSSGSHTINPSKAEGLR